MKQQQGFTLIELVMVIVVLGVLAATAMPKFVNMKGDAQAAALQGVAGSIKSALAMNYAIRGMNPASGVGTIVTSTVADHACTIIFNGILEGGLPTSYTLPTNTRNQAGANPFGFTGSPPGTVNTCLLSDGVSEITISITMVQ